MQEANEILEMWEDKRSIKGIVMAGEGGDYWDVGRGGVTCIIAYGENGQMAEVTWLAVYEGDWLAHRVNAAHVESVWYGKAPENTKE